MPRRGLTLGERVEVPAATCDLGLLSLTNLEELALRLDDEVDALLVLLLDEDCPVWVVATEWCGDLEPAGELRVELDRRVVLEVSCEGLLDV